MVQSSERKIIRPLDPERDGAALHAIFGDEESCRYLPDPAFSSIAQTTAVLKKWTSGTEDTSWAIIDEEDGEALGRVSLFTEGRDIWEVACMVVPSARGRGLAETALRIAIDDVLARKNARRIFADVDPENFGSIRTFERLGFIREGVMRAAWETHIGVRDSIIFSLLQSDPRPWLNP